MGDHRVALDGAGAALACKVGCDGGERTAHSATTEARAGDEAGNCPDAVVGLVLSSSGPRDTGAQQALVRRAGLDCTPAGGLAVEVGDQAARRGGVGVAAVGLLAQPVGAFLKGSRAPRGIPHLVSLALAESRIAAGAEDGPQVVPGRFIRRHNGDRRRPGRVSHRRSFLDRTAS